LVVIVNRRLTIVLPHASVNSSSSRAVIGGLAASTIATLLVLPALFALANVVPVWRRRRSIIVGVTVLCVTATWLEGQSNIAAVDTTRVVAQVLQKSVTIPGDLTPYQGVKLTARVPSFVESLAVDRGSWVKRGQRLASISAPELHAQRAEAEAKLQAVRAQEAESQARMVSAQSTYERLKAASAHAGGRRRERPRDRGTRPRSRAGARERPEK
jgi:multidrug efflux pump subunit AcrA (membrane-fusion protein)